MSDNETVNQKSDSPPPFDPDPALVADLEGNAAALRDLRRTAQKEHEAAEKERDLRAAG